MEWYGAKCLQCHRQEQCTRGPDCAGCHMPAKPVQDVDHSFYTDHNIRRTGTPQMRALGTPDLTPFIGMKAGNREHGLAWAGQHGYESRAIQFLEKAEDRDAELLSQLGSLYDATGREERAIPLYQQALKLDSSKVMALVNLGAALAKKGQPTAAIPLLQDTLRRSPGLENVALGLANIQMHIGDRRREGHAAAVAETRPCFRGCSPLSGGSGEREVKG